MSVLGPLPIPTKAVLVTPATSAPLLNYQQALTANVTANAGAWTPVFTQLLNPGAWLALWRVQWRPSAAGTIDLGIYGPSGPFVVTTESGAAASTYYANTLAYILSLAAPTTVTCQVYPTLISAYLEAVSAIVNGPNANSVAFVKLS